jgi:hypothetical protein
MNANAQEPDVNCRRLFAAAVCTHFLETNSFPVDIRSTREFSRWALTHLDDEITLISSQEQLVEERMWKISQKTSHPVQQATVRAFTRKWKPMKKLVRNFGYRHLITEWTTQLRPLWNGDPIKPSAMAQFLDHHPEFGRDYPGDHEEQANNELPQITGTSGKK